MFFYQSALCKDLAGTFMFKGSDDSLVESLNIFGSSLAFSAGSYFKWFRVAPTNIVANEANSPFSGNETPSEQGLTALAALDQYLTLAVTRHHKAIARGTKKPIALGWLGIMMDSGQIQGIEGELNQDATSNLGLVGLFIKMLNPFSPVRLFELNPQTGLIQVAAKKYDPSLQQSIFNALSKKMLEISAATRRFAGKWPVNQISFDLTNLDHWNLLSEITLPAFAGGEFLVNDRPSNSFASMKIIYPALGMANVQGKTLTMTPFVENVKTLGTSFYRIERIAYGGLFSTTGQGSAMAARFFKNFEQPQKLFLEASFGDVVKATGFDVVNVLSTNPDQALRILVRPDFKFGSASLLGMLEKAGLVPKDAFAVQMSFHKLAVDMERPQAKLTERSKFAWTLNTRASIISYTLCSRLGLISMVLAGLPEFQEIQDASECSDIGVSGSGLRVFRLVGDDGRGISNFLNNVVLKNSFGKLQGNMENTFNQDIGTAIAAAIERGREVRKTVYDALKKAK